MTETPTLDILDQIAADRSNTGVWQQLLENNQDCWLRIGMSVLKEKGLAEDAIQDAMLYLYEHIQEARSLKTRSEQTASAWLKRIVYSCARQLRKSNQRRDKRHVDHGVAVHGQAEQDPSEAFVKNEFLKQVAEQKERLPEKQQVPLRLFYEAGLSYEDIALTMNISKVNARVRVHRAIKSLTNQLIKLGVPCTLWSVSNVLSSSEFSQTNIAEHLSDAIVNGKCVANESIINTVHIELNSIGVLKMTISGVVAVLSIGLAMGIVFSGSGHTQEGTVNKQHHQRVVELKEEDKRDYKKRIEGYLTSMHATEPLDLEKICGPSLLDQNNYLEDTFEIKNLKIRKIDKKHIADYKKSKEWFAKRVRKNQNIRVVVFELITSQQTDKALAQIRNYYKEKGFLLPDSVILLECDAYTEDLNDSRTKGVDQRVFSKKYTVLIDAESKKFYGCLYGVFKNKGEAKSPGVKVASETSPDQVNARNLRTIIIKMKKNRVDTRNVFPNPWKAAGKAFPKVSNPREGQRVTAAIFEFLAARHGLKSEVFSDPYNSMGKLELTPRTAAEIVDEPNVLWARDYALDWSAPKTSGIHRAIMSTRTPSDKGFIVVFADTHIAEPSEFAVEKISAKDQQQRTNNNSDMRFKVKYKITGDDIFSPEGDGDKVYSFSSGNRIRAYMK